MGVFLAHSVYESTVNFKTVCSKQVQSLSCIIILLKMFYSVSYNISCEYDFKFKLLIVSICVMQNSQVLYCVNSTARKSKFDRILLINV